MEEQNVHDVVNSDDQMYKELEDIPMDSEDVTDQMIGVIQSHVSEVWSPPRVTKLANAYGLSPGFAYDIEVDDEMANFGTLTSQSKGRNACSTSGTKGRIS